MASSSDLMDMVRKLMSKVDTLSGQVTNISLRLSHVEKNVDFVKSQLVDHATNSMTYAIVDQARKGLSSQVYSSNPFNLMFYGLPQRQGLSLENSFRQVLVELLKMEHSRAYMMPIFVQEMPKMSQGDAHVPLCISFRSDRDRLDVKRRAENLSSTLIASGIWAEGTEFSEDGFKIWSSRK